MKKSNLAHERHEFALYFPHLAGWLQDVQNKKNAILQDVDIYHRIMKVLRLVAGDTFILFDCFDHVYCTLQKVEKKSIVHIIVIERKKNRKLTPTVNFLLPLLKRDALHDAIYSLTELGATEIQLVITDKSQKRWSSREHEKLMRIVHAAAEQSKNFSFPFLKEPQPLNQILEEIDKTKKGLVFFDPVGQPVTDVIEKLSDDKIKNLFLMIGPEGDLSPGEKDLVKKKGFIFTSLTPTILRARQAVVVSLGIFRSFLS